MSNVKATQVSGQKPRPKVELKVKKVIVTKSGINAGITGGGYQCC